MRTTKTMVKSERTSHHVRAGNPQSCFIHHPRFGSLERSLFMRRGEYQYPVFHNVTFIIHFLFSPTIQILHLEPCISISQVTN